MSFVSLEFFAFLFLCIGIYHVAPSKIKGIVLLLASLSFYGIYGINYLIILVTMTILSYLSGLLITKIDGNVKKVALAISIVLQIGALIYFKYIGFLTGDKVKSIMLPVGISFYLLMTTGYLIDTYRGNIKTKANILNYALFVSFFPTILSGPIERGEHMLSQFTTEKLENIKFDTERIRDGFVRILWGLFMKAVIADNIANMVSTVYSSPQNYGGCIVLTTIILYTFQIYCDFAGYTNMAIGIAKCFGIEVMENFKQPYLATSIADFWRRWHISLSSWLRDYIYIPLGGNRKGIIRKYVNVLIVFLVSGIWHGANWTFIYWGLLHGLYQVVGALMEPVKKQIQKLLKLEAESFSLRAFRIAFNFALVSFAWIIFQASNITEVITICKQLRTPMLHQIYTGGLYNLGLEAMQVNVSFIGILVVIIVDILNEKKIYVAEKIAKERLWIRWPIYIMAILIILLCGAWGTEYAASSFIYQVF